MVTRQSDARLGVFDEDAPALAGGTDGAEDEE